VRSVGRLLGEGGIFSEGCCYSTCGPATPPPWCGSRHAKCCVRARSRQTARATHTALDLAIAHFQQNSTKNEQISLSSVPYSDAQLYKRISGVASGGDPLPKCLSWRVCEVSTILLPLCIWIPMNSSLEI
jgi:hypothetical protein